MTRRDSHEKIQPIDFVVSGLVFNFVRFAFTGEWHGEGRGEGFLKQNDPNRHGATSNKRLAVQVGIHFHTEP